MSSQDQKPPIDISVTVDPKNMEALLKQIEEERERRKEAEKKLEGKTTELEEKTTELEDLKGKATVIAEKMFQRKKEALGCYDELVTTPEQLEFWERGHGKPVKSSPSGTVPLSDAQRGINSQGYDSYEELVADLREKAKSTDQRVSQEAEAVLNELWKKSVEGLKSDEFKGVPEYIEKRSLKEVLNEQFRRKKVNK